MMGRLLLIFSAIFSVWLPALAQGQETPSERLLTVQIQVEDSLSRLPLADVEVRARQLGMQGFTDRNGQIVVPGVRRGTYLFEFEKAGYEGVVGMLQLFEEREVSVALISEDAPVGEGGAVRGGEGTEMAAIVGRVIDADTGVPVEGAWVDFLTNNSSGVTDAQGVFRIHGVSPGDYVVKLHRMGYEKREESLSVGSGQRIEIQVELGIKPVALAPMEVIVERRVRRLELAGFYSRRMLTAGQFLAQEEIEERTVADVTDLFTAFSGVRFVYQKRHDRTPMITLGRSQASNSIAIQQGMCFPAVWIDDVQITEGGREPAELNRRLNPETVAGIEVYKGPAEAPARYSGTGRACGVILIWTRG